MSHEPAALCTDRRRLHVQTTTVISLNKERDLSQVNVTLLKGEDGGGREGGAGRGGRGWWGVFPFSKTP